MSLGDARSSSPVAGKVTVIAEIHDGVSNDALQGEFGQHWLGADELVDDASPRPEGASAYGCFRSSI